MTAVCVRRRSLKHFSTGYWSPILWAVRRHLYELRYLEYELDLIRQLLHIETSLNEHVNDSMNPRSATFVKEGHQYTSVMRTGHSTSFVNQPTIVQHTSKHKGRLNWFYLDSCFCWKKLCRAINSDHPTMVSLYTNPTGLGQHLLWRKTLDALLWSGCWILLLEGGSFVHWHLS